MKRLQLLFEAYPPRFDEVSAPELSPEAEALLFARQKALSLKPLFPQAAIVGSDTLVVLENEKLGKPASAEEAEAMLRKLAGRTHRVLTAVAVWHGPSGGLREVLAEARVTFKPMTEKEIGDYVNTGEPLDKAGAYAIQGLGAKYIQSLEGEVETVIGLPLRELHTILQEMGIFLPPLGL